MTTTQWTILLLTSAALLTIPCRGAEQAVKAKDSNANNNKLTFKSMKKEVIKNDDGKYVFVQDKYDINIGIDVSGLPNFLDGIDKDTELNIYFDLYLDLKYWLKNNGSGSFSKGTLVGSSLDYIENFVDLGDIDGDGDLDAVVTNDYYSRLWFKNDGQGGFLNTGLTVGSSDSIHMDLGDVDGDGDLDAFVANDMEANRLWLNDGAGNFTDSGQDLYEDATLNVVFGYFDDNGAETKTLDAFVSNETANRVWLNGVDGNPVGTFSTRSQYLGDSVSSDVKAADLNGDGKTDVFVANYNANKVWLNGIDGKKTGFFTDSGQLLGKIGETESGKAIYSTSNGVSLGDIDGDGDSDAFVANNGINAVWANDGTGTFTKTTQNFDNYDFESFAVALGDFNGDGKQDAFVANSDANILWFNAPDEGDVIGTFKNRAQLLGDRDSRGIAFAPFSKAENDVVVANYGEPSKVWDNDGKGNFIETYQDFGDLGTDESGRKIYAKSNAVAVGDISGDGWDDFVLANDGANLAYIYAGNMGFLGTGQNIGNSSSSDIALADLNGDAVADAFVANYGEQNVVWMNDGKGQFTEHQRLGEAITEGAEVVYPSSTCVVLGDFTGDGVLDAFVGNDADPCKLYVNQDKLGTFVDSGQNLGKMADGSYDSTFGVVMGDLDGDGDLDVITLNEGPNRVYLNAAGVFPESGSSTIGDGSSYGGYLADVDGDDDLDLYVANWGDNKLWLNDSHGVFSDSGAILGDSDSNGVVLADFTGDGKIDAYVANDGLNKLWQGRGDGTFFNFLLGGSVTYGVALGDVNGDGALDAVTANDSFSGNGVWLNVNDGSGNLIDSGQRLGSLGDDDYDDSYGVGLADLNGDGHLDAFFANDGANKVFTNNGAGVFTDSGQKLGSAMSQGVQLTDVDGDGDVDAFVLNDGANKVWLNDGAGTFTDSGQSMGESISWNSAMVDFDGDGDVDAYVANDEENKLWTSDGKGAFNTQQLGNSYSYKTVAGDLDGDGDLDLFVANEEANKVWLNDGNANFFDSGQSLGEEDSNSVALGDIDGDGDLDAVTANYGSNAGVWLNDGAGNFTAGTAIEASGIAVALGDMNGDGKLDAFISDEDQATVWTGNGDGTFTAGETIESIETENNNLELGDIDGDGSLDAFVPLLVEVDGSEQFELETTLAEAEKNGGGTVDDESDGKYCKLSIKNGKGGSAKFVAAEEDFFYWGDKTKYKKVYTVTVRWNAKKLNIVVKGTPQLDTDLNLIDLYDEVDELKDEVTATNKKVIKDITENDGKFTNCAVTFNNYLWDNLEITYIGREQAQYKKYKDYGDTYEETLGSWNVKSVKSTINYVGQIVEEDSTDTSTGSLVE